MIYKKYFILFIFIFIKNCNCFIYSNYYIQKRNKIFNLYCNVDYNIPNFIERINYSFDKKITEIRYSKFINEVENNNIDKTIIINNEKKILAYDKYNNKYKLNKIPKDPNLFNILHNNNVDIIIDNNDYINTSMIVINFIMIFFYVKILQLFMSNMFNNNNNNNNFNNNNNNFNLVNNSNIYFNDIVGIDNIRFELEEVVNFLKNNETYTDLGAQIPKGIILNGPPGSGKTLLARAVANEAKVSFIQVSGSEFIEMIIGTGASRIRNLFQKAKENSPCIIFIDEIDSIGKKREKNSNNDEKEQTINQLLTEMDGFENNKGVIVLAATNRLDLLDEALLRPGRFDRKIFIDNPNYLGRIDILKYYSKNKTISDNINYNNISLLTSGYSGATLKNIMNEAAILTIRNNKTIISNNEINLALNKVLYGINKKKEINYLKNKEIIAIHEAGHAIVGLSIKNYDNIEKITILSNNQNQGGNTIFLPDEKNIESGLYSRQYMLSMICVLLSGRIAEELIFNNDNISNLASNDFEKVNNIARSMITEYGMSKILGNVNLKNNQNSIDTNNLINKEIDNIIKICYYHSKNILLNNLEFLKILANSLVINDTLDKKDINDLINLNNITLIKSNQYINY
tara:strand:+ start:460 stop:2346 length:1887 start_codon:yes stop_codon:yes gene_type:complete